jgi:hypothetical protein
LCVPWVKPMFCRDAYHFINFFFKYFLWLIFNIENITLFPFFKYTVSEKWNLKKDKHILLSYKCTIRLETSYINLVYPLYTIMLYIYINKKMTASYII